MSQERPDSAGITDIDFASVFAAFMRRRWAFLAVLALSLAGGWLDIRMTPPLYSSAALILIDKEDKGRGQADLVLSESRTDDYYQTQFMLLRSRSLLKKVYGDLGLDKTEDFAGGVDSFASAVAVTPLAKSRLVTVAVSAHDPALCARAANAVADDYVAQNLENKLFISKEILETLQGTKAGDQEENYEALPAVVNNALIQSLKGNYANLEAKRGELASRYTSQHPQRVRLEAEMAAVKERIRDETLKAVKSLKSELSGKLLGNNVRVVDPAEAPTSPIRPNKRRIMSLAAVFGLLGGLLAALELDNLDQTIYSQEDVEKRLGVPLLGTIPKTAAFLGQKSEDFHELLKGPQSFTAESFKNIRTMIGFAGADRPLKRILITSTIQGEGKTFMAINLAMVFAQLGQRVLVIEGDLRRPSLHKRFGLSKELGLSHFLAHGRSAADIEPLVHRTATANLKVIACGPIPPNPSELLSTPRLKALLAWATENFDMVLIDGTPVFPITDALLWSREVDGAIFVVKFGGVNAKLAAKAREKLQEGGIRIAGAVMNQVTARGNSYYGDYYYQYHYYTQNDKRA